MAIQTVAWVGRPIPFMNWCHKHWGDVIRLKLQPMDVVLVSDPDTIRRVFTGDADEFRAGEVNVILEPLVGSHSVLLLDGAEHMRHRKLLLPAFHGERMRLYAQTMQEITERTVGEWGDGETIALHPHMQSITLEVILRTVFGVDEGAGLVELRDQLRRVLGVVDSPASSFLLVPAFRRKLGPWAPWDRFVAELERANALIYREIARRRASSASSAERSDMLSMLLEARDEAGAPLSDVELRDELVTALVAGHETTATALSWAFERILATPEVYARVREELSAVLGGGPLLAEHLGRLEYLDATIKEVLRLRPVIPMVGRKLHAPLRIGEWEIPPGFAVAPSIYLTHRRPDVYPDPEAFRPERFLGKRPDPYSWLPFGGGVRRCLGMAFALYEMKVVMATVLARVSLELAQPAPIRTVRRAITFSPEGGTRVRTRRREHRLGATLRGSHASAQSTA